MNVMIGRLQQPFGGFLVSMVVLMLRLRYSKTSTMITLIAD